MKNNSTCCFKNETQGKCNARRCVEAWVPPRNLGYLWQSLTTDCLGISCNLLEVLGYLEEWSDVRLTGTLLLAETISAFRASRNWAWQGRKHRTNFIRCIHISKMFNKRTMNFPSLRQVEVEKNKIKSNIVQLTWTLSPSIWCTDMHCQDLFCFRVLCRVY